MTFNDVFNETFAGDVENLAAGQTFNRTGTIEIKADGYGDIVLPYATVSNVLRVRTILNYSDTYMGTEVYSYTDTIYTWYTAGTNTLIASVTLGYVDGSPWARQATYMKQSSLTSAADDLQSDDKHLSVYPCPAAHFFMLANVQEGPGLMHLHDINGKLVKTATIQTGAQQINISDLNPGVYIISCTAKSRHYTEKLIVE